MPHTIQSLLSDAQKKLHKNFDSETARCDSEYLLSFVLNKPRTHLYAWSKEALSEEITVKFHEVLKQRLKEIPLAYILGTQSFWNFELIVTRDTLIPRADTELLVELALSLFSNDENIHCADLGTGSGAIALALTSERSAWTIHATDQSAAALAVAQENAEKLGLVEVQFFEGAWCEALPGKNYDLIVSNPPYIASNDPHLLDKGLCYEPRDALEAGLDGLVDISIIIEQAVSYLKNGGILMLEHGYEQTNAVSTVLEEYNFRALKTYRDIQGHPRVTQGSLTLDENRRNSSK